MKIESQNKWEEIDVKNCTCVYFDDIIQIEDFNFYNILINERSYKNILVYNISYKTSIGSKPLRIRFDKVNEFFRISDVTRYLILFGPEKYDAIFNRIRCLIRVKGGIS